jgi:hypothetical protein
MATAVMGTDHMEGIRRRLELDLERTGHGRVHGVPGGGDVKESRSAKDRGMKHLKIFEPKSLYFS